MQASSKTTDTSTTDVPSLTPARSSIDNPASATASSSSIADADSVPVFDTAVQGASGHRLDISESAEEPEACVSSEQIGPTKGLENENDNCSNDADDGDNASEISDFSNFSQESWQPVQGPIAWVQEQMRQGQSPRKILGDLVPTGTIIPEGLDPIMLWKIIINIVSEPPKRKKLHDINTLDDVLRLLNNCKKIIVLTGAGVSVSCGIPDFRSRDGVYARLAKDFPNLPDPQAMFDIHFFRSDPRPFFKFAREIYPGQFQPSLCHRFIRLLEEKGQLLRNYTQNIDTLEQVAGIERVVQCHGSFATATCAVCGHQVDSDAIKEDIFNQVIPRCPRCSPSNHGAVMKPDIVFFGESLPEHFHNQMAADKDECDLLIVIGSSLKVRPVALIPNSLPAHVPQILINRERLRYLNFDVELLGNCDDIVGELCRRLGVGWEQLASPGPPLDEVAMSSLPTPPISPQSGESRDKWDDLSNTAISSTEAHHQSHENFVSLKPSSEKHTEAEGFLSGSVSENIVSSHTPTQTADKDVGVPEVSTSLSESALTKTHRSHHHRHSLKRPFSSLNSGDGSLHVPEDQLSSSFSQSDQTAHNSCSSAEMESLVSACHKRDVMYIPCEKTSSCHHSQSTAPHSHHHHHQHDSAKSHSHHHDRSKPSPSGLTDQPSASEQTDPHDHHYHHHNHTEHSDSSSVPEPPQPSDSTVNQPDQRVGFDVSQPQLSPCQLTKPEPQACSHYAVEADSQVTEDEGDSPNKKRLKLSGDEQDSVESDRKNPNDSLSHEDSLDDIRKMWRGKRRISLAQRLTDNQVLFLPPSRYVFKGAEVFSESESEDSEDDDEEDESSIDSDVEVAPPDMSNQEMAEDPNMAGPVADSSSTASQFTNILGSDLQQELLPSTGDIADQSDVSSQVTSDATSNSGPQQSECSPEPGTAHTQTAHSGVMCPVTSTADLVSEPMGEADEDDPQSLHSQTS